MEDSHFVRERFREDLHLFGVCDGHGGIEVAEFVKECFVSELLLLESFNGKDPDYKQALKECFINLDKKLRTQEGQKNSEILALKNR